MNVNDLHHTSSAVIAFANANITTDTTTAGAIIDTAGFEACEILTASGTITDGAYAMLLQEGDAANLSDAATVSAEETLGDCSYALAEDDTPKRVGYIGKKRYVRLSWVSTATTTGGTNFSAIAILANAQHQPVADQ